MIPVVVVDLQTIGDLASAAPSLLDALLGKQAPRMAEFARGVDHRPVQPFRQAKSVSNETTFEEDTADQALLREKIDELAQRVSERLLRRGLQGQTVVLKLTYRNFEHVSRRVTLDHPTADAQLIGVAAAKLLDRSEARVRLVRLIGVGLTALTRNPDTSPQLNFLDP